MTAPPPRRQRAGGASRPPGLTGAGSGRSGRVRGDGREAAFAEHGQPLRGLDRAPQPIRSGPVCPKAAAVKAACGRAHRCGRGSGRERSGLATSVRRAGRRRPPTRSAAGKRAGERRRAERVSWSRGCAAAAGVGHARSGRRRRPQSPTQARPSSDDSGVTGSRLGSPRRPPNGMRRTPHAGAGPTGRASRRRGRSWPRLTVRTADRAVGNRTDGILVATELVARDRTDRDGADASQAEGGRPYRSCARRRAHGLKQKARAARAPAGLSEGERRGSTRPRQRHAHARGPSAREPACLVACADG